MKDQRLCDRPVYKDNVCLMHSRDPNKNDKKFQDEFDSILKKAGETEADFWGFFFPSSNYTGREFAAKCIFINATFLQDADFSCTKFKKDANFGQARFAEHATFEAAIFEQGVYFSLATFTKVADFRQTVFRDVVEFRETVFRDDRELREGHADDDRSFGPVFWKARFEKPKAVMFYWTYMGQALLNGCDPSEFLFYQVVWGKRSNGRSRLFEEIVKFNFDDPLEKRVAEEALKSLKAKPGWGDERNYNSIAELYQLMKKNFENHGDELTSGDFYYGQMEVRRLSSPIHGRLARWLVQNLGLMGLYRKVSEYGESYWRPLIWALIVAVVFTFIYPLIGLRQSPEKAKGVETDSAHAGLTRGTTPVVTYWHPTGGSSEEAEKKWHSRIRLVGHSLMTSLGVAFFQRDIATFEPTYPWGRALQSLELVLTYALLAVFLQVLGRKFKR